MVRREPWGWGLERGAVEVGEEGEEEAAMGGGGGAAEERGGDRGGGHGVGRVRRGRPAACGWGSWPPWGGRKKGRGEAARERRLR